MSLLTLVLLFGCGPRGSEPAGPAQQTGDLPDQEGWRSTITATTGDRIAAVINYGHMRRYSEKRAVEFDEGIKVDFFDKSGQHASLLTADGGRFDEGSNDVEAIGHVVVVSDSGITLRTERLRWDRESEKIVTDAFVTITTTEGDTLYGHGFESDPNLTQWEIEKPSGVSSKRVVLEPRKSLNPDLGRTAADSGGAESLPDSAVVVKKAAPDSAGDLRQSKRKSP